MNIEDRSDTGFLLRRDFNARAQIIAFGERLGQVLCAKDRPQPWMIRLDGDFNGGKSLLALAVDKGFRPEAYPDGLNHSVYIETIMPDWFRNPPGSLKTVFKHFAHQVCQTLIDFDGELAAFEEKNSQARLLFASNLHHKSNDRENTLNSNRLDLTLRIVKTGESYSRRVDVIARDPTIIAALG